MWCVPTEKALSSEPLDTLGPEAATISAAELARRFAALPNTRLHSFLRDQHAIAGLGRRLANEVCHRAKLSPFAMTHKLDADAAAAIVEAISEAVDEGLDEERQRPDMSASKDRSSRVHHRTGQPCAVCGDTIRAVEYASYTVNYCPTCQTGGKVLADNIDEQVPQVDGARAVLTSRQRAKGAGRERPKGLNEVRLAAGRLQAC